MKMQEVIYVTVHENIAKFVYRQVELRDARTGEKSYVAGLLHEIMDSPVTFGDVEYQPVESRQWDLTQGIVYLEKNYSESDGVDPDSPWRKFKTAEECWEKRPVLDHVAALLHIRNGVQRDMLGKEVSEERESRTRT